MHALPEEASVMEPEVPDTVTPARPPRWRVAAILASSALLSGIAVVLWNRRTLERMREAGPGRPPEPGPEEFI